MSNPNAAPVEAPKEIIPEAPAPAAGVSEGVPGGVEGGVPGGVLGGVVGGLPEAPPPPPPPPQAPVRVGGNIKTPTKIKDVRPVYPPIAQSARVQGMVIIEATIGADGRVKDAKVLRSIPLLDQAALDAVKQWQFTPTLLNGVPVPVIMTVTVNFTLQ
ncbi:MAG TPA: energy transducer TonB [Vicinamibacterales bacterium]|nr:energy transducer TonB [Vicinamibacterales bacterium]